MNPADLVLTAADGAAFWLPVAWLPLWRWSSKKARWYRAV